MQEADKVPGKGCVKKKKKAFTSFCQPMRLITCANHGNHVQQNDCVMLCALYAIQCLSRKLQGPGRQTFIGMLGCCSKAAVLLHWVNISKRVQQEDLESWQGAVRLPCIMK